MPEGDRESMFETEDGDVWCCERCYRIARDTGEID